MDKKKENPQKAHRYERRSEELRANLKRRKEIARASVKESALSSDHSSEKEKQN